MNRLTRMARAAHYGSRARLAEPVERRVAKHTPLSREALRSLVGGLFLFWSARRVVRALRAGLRPR
mgnify:FL=1